MGKLIKGSLYRKAGLVVDPKKEVCLEYNGFNIHIRYAGRANVEYQRAMTAWKNI